MFLKYTLLKASKSYKKYLEIDGVSTKPSDFNQSQCIEP